MLLRLERLYGFGYLVFSLDLSPFRLWRHLFAIVRRSFSSLWHAGVGEFDMANGRRAQGPGVTMRLVPSLRIDLRRLL